MFWLILAVIFLGLAIYAIGCIVANDDLAGGGLACCLVMISVFIGIFYYSKAAWETEMNFLARYPTIVVNKQIKINEMKKTFYKVSGGNQINIDLVNKDLTVNINDNIAQIENFLTDYYEKRERGKVAYKNRFITCCYVKFDNLPEIEMPSFK